MNSRERLLAALNHQEPDRIPFDLGSTQVSGIHVIAYQRSARVSRLATGRTDRFATSCKDWHCPTMM